MGVLDFIIYIDEQEVVDSRLGMEADLLFEGVSYQLIVDGNICMYVIVFREYCEMCARGRRA